MGLILLIVLILVLFGSGGYYIAPAHYGPHFAAGGLGIVIVILLVLFLLGFIRLDN